MTITEARSRLRFALKVQPLIDQDDADGLPVAASWRQQAHQAIQECQRVIEQARKQAAT